MVDGIFKYIFLKISFFCRFIQISLQLCFSMPVNSSSPDHRFWLRFHWSLFLRNQSIIAQHYLNQCWLDSLTHICVTRLQRVNNMSTWPSSLKHTWHQAPLLLWGVSLYDDKLVPISIINWWHAEGWQWWYQYNYKLKFVLAMHHAKNWGAIQ